MWHKLTFIPHILIFRRNLVGNNFSLVRKKRCEKHVCNRDSIELMDSPCIFPDC